MVSWICRQILPLCLRNGSKQMDGGASGLPLLRRTGFCQPGEYEMYSRSAIKKFSF